MTVLLKHVDAVFDGERRRFELERRHIAAFENALGDSAFAAMKRFFEGTWLFRDVEKVLVYSHPDVGATEVEKQFSALLRSIETHQTAMSPSFASIGTARTDRRISELLVEHGHARYADLAGKVLAAAVMGLAPDEAHFDDGSLDADPESETSE